MAKTRQIKVLYVLFPDWNTGSEAAGRAPPVLNSSAKPQRKCRSGDAVEYRGPRRRKPLRRHSRPSPRHRCRFPRDTGGSPSPSRAPLPTRWVLPRNSIYFTIPFDSLDIRTLRPRIEEAFGQILAHFTIVTWLRLFQNSSKILSRIPAISVASMHETSTRYIVIG